MKGAKRYTSFLPGWQANVFARMAWLFLMAMVLLALLGPFLANDKPYFCRLEGQTYYPLFSGKTEAELSILHPEYSPVNWHTTPFEKIWRAPVPFSHRSIDLVTGAYKAPLHAPVEQARFRHWLGTDAIGRDVLAGLIRGCRVSLLIGFGAMIVAFLIGVPFGAISAYYGNKDLRWSFPQLLLFLLLLFTLVVVFLSTFSSIIKGLLVILLIILSGWVMTRLSRTLRGRVRMPVDHMVMGLISITDGFPALFLIILIVALVPVKGWIVVMLVIALLRWPTMARYMRAEVFKIKAANYFQSAQLLNIPSGQILTRHVVPYALRPVMISFVFGVASAILAESSLSFLGLGMPTDEINWGRLLAQSRNHFSAWWLVVFPGLAIFLTMLSLYTIGNVLEPGRKGNR